MTLQGELISLMQRLGQGKHSASITFDEVKHWPSEALSLLITENFIETINPASELLCTGCPENCLKSVHMLTNQHGKLTRHFIVCDENDYMGKIPIQAMQLQQWRITDALLVVWLANKMGIRHNAGRSNEKSNIPIGFWNVDKSSYPVNLDFADVLSLKINQILIPLEQVVYVEDGQLIIDQDVIQSLAKQSSSTASESQYQPNTLKRELRKQQTAHLHSEWHKAYLKLKREQPKKSDTWISRQIEKTDIAQGRDSETIRKNMKG